MEDAVRENCKIPGLALVLSEHMSVLVVLSKAVKISICHDCLAAESVLLWAEKTSRGSPSLWSHGVKQPRHSCRVGTN